MSRHIITAAVFVASLFGAPPVMAQTVTIEPVVPVPVSGPLGLLLLAGLLLAAAAWLLARRQPATGVAVLAAGAAAIGGVTFFAQSTSTFTNPAGETLPIPVTQIASGDDVAGWQWADFTNGTGVSQLISGIEAPTFAQCVPGNLVGTLLPPGTSPSATACSEGMTLAAGATCRIDVDAICRAAAAGQLATLTAVAPLSGPTGTVVTLTGTNLTGATAVTLDGAPATGVTVVNATTVTATVPAHAPGVVDVAVMTPRGRATLADGFTYVSGTTLTGISPTSGVASGGVGVILTGTGLTGATSVTFGGVPATSVNVVNSTTITAVTPAHAVGVVDVVVDTPAGPASLVDGYTYVVTAVGMPSGGGIIAAINGGLNNLIAAVADNSTSIEFGGLGTAIGAAAQSNADGASNTAAIVAALGNNGGTPYAAQLCTNYEVDSQGNTPCQAGNVCYNDWFLPAGNNSTPSGQLNALITNRLVIGGFVSGNYHSSTEFSTNPTLASWIQSTTGGEFAALKNLAVSVRCVRAFAP